MLKTQGRKNPQTTLLRSAFEGSIQKNKFKRSCPIVTPPIAEYEQEIEVYLQLAELGSLLASSGKEITRITWPL